MKRVNTFGTFLETIKPDSQSPRPSSAVRSAEAGPSLQTSARLALRVINVLSKVPEMPVAILMKQTAADPFEFAKVLQDLENLNPVLFDRSTDATLVHIGPAWQDVRPL